MLLLERNDYEVVEAANGEEASAIFRARPPDLVITDIFMPKMEGFETIRAMRKVVPDMKIIAISGGSPNGAQDILALASKHGADGTFAKPIERQEFLSSISRLLAAA